jgi:hypothetical protein
MGVLSKYSARSEPVCGGVALLLSPMEAAEGGEELRRSKKAKKRKDEQKQSVKENATRNTHTPPCHPPPRYGSSVFPSCCGLLNFCLPRRCPRTWGTPLFLSSNALLHSLGRVLLLFGLFLCFGLIVQWAFSLINFFGFFLYFLFVFLAS